LVVYFIHGPKFGSLIHDVITDLSAGDLLHVLVETHDAREFLVKDLIDREIKGLLHPHVVFEEASVEVKAEGIDHGLQLRDEDRLIPQDGIVPEGHHVLDTKGLESLCKPVGDRDGKDQEVDV
jgi:hypothetical protein